MEYGLTMDYGSVTELNPFLVLLHSYELSGLTPETIYHFRVKSKDTTGNLAVSSDNIFTTKSPAPIISSIEVINIRDTSVTITWVTDKPATSKVNYGLTSSYALSTVKDQSQTTKHSLTIGKLTPSTTYHYQIESTDVYGSSASSDDLTFTTIATPVYPVISNVKATDITKNSATITWKTDKPSDSQVRYGLSTDYGFHSPLDPALVTQHTVKLTGLSQGASYLYRVKSGSSLSVYKTFYTPSVDSDTVTPAKTANLAAVSSTQNSIELSWTAPGDDDATGTALSYEIRWYILPITDDNWRNAFLLSGVPSPQVSGTAQSYTAIGLTPNTTYYFALQTADEAGNKSRLSNIASGKTKRRPPLSVANAKSSIDGSAIKIGWSSPEDADSDVKYLVLKNTVGGLPFYKLTKNETKLYEGSDLSAKDVNISEGTTYCYTVFAYYDSGSYSPGSFIGVKKEGKKIIALSQGSGGVRTPFDTTPPGQIKLERVTEADGQVLLEWTNPADEDFARVLITKKSDSQPVSINDGSTVLEASSTSHLVFNLENDKAYYLAIYSIDLTKNYSKPVIVKVVPKAGVVSLKEGEAIGTIVQTESYITATPTPTPTLVPAVPEKITLPAPSFTDGTLLKGSGPTIYYIEGSKKRAFSSYSVFELLGYKLANIKIIPDSDLNSISTADLITTIDAHPNGTLVKLASDPKIYLIEDGKLRWIVSLELFKTKGYAFEQVIAVSQTEFDGYQKGEEVR